MARTLLTLCASLLASTFGTGAPSGAILPSGDHAAARDPVPVAALPIQEASVPAEPAPSSQAVAEPPLRIASAKSLIIAPRGCSALGKSFDVLIHFHGAYTTTEPQLMKSGIDAVYVVKNLGNGSGPYESAFGSPKAFDHEIEAIRARINKSCGGEERSVGRIALSGWSAGYGAIYRILARSKDAARVDAVVLADGMHVGYEPGSKKIRGAAMTPFLDFAAAAARGDKLMAVTHSAIVPPTYASTTETARFIVRQLNVPPASVSAPEPREGMRQTSSETQGDLHVSGFAGGDKRAHCDHLYAIEKTLWSRVRERWNRR